MSRTVLCVSWGRPQHKTERGLMPCAWEAAGPCSTEGRAASEEEEHCAEKAWVLRAHNPLWECSLRFYWYFRLLSRGDNICMLFLHSAVHRSRKALSPVPPSPFITGSKSSGFSSHSCQRSRPDEASHVAKSISRQLSVAFCFEIPCCSYLLL